MREGGGGKEEKGKGDRRRGGCCEGVGKRTVMVGEVGGWAGGLVGGGDMGNGKSRVSVEIGSEGSSGIT